jgi:hypothetical protein
MNASFSSYALALSATSQQSFPYRSIRAGIAIFGVTGLDRYLNQPVYHSLIEPEKIGKPTGLTSIPVRFLRFKKQPVHGLVNPASQTASRTFLSKQIRQQ